MKWLYLLLWGALAVSELRQSDRKQWLVWLLIGGVGLALAVWVLWLGTDWRLAEAVGGFYS